MTFYNVISGILFLGACQVFLRNLGDPLMWPSAALMITILNEAVMTSELIETNGPHRVDYSLKMKLLDFVTFLILSSALLVLSPSQNVFEVQFQAENNPLVSPRLFWGLLSAYWLLMLVWNWVAGQTSSPLWKPFFRTWMRWMWIGPLVALLVAVAFPTFESRPIQDVSKLYLALVVGYLLCKPFARTNPNPAGPAR